MSSSPIPPRPPLPSQQQTPNHVHHLHHNPRRAVDLRIPAIEKYAYCLCLHVKPTTIFIAVFKLIRALLFASLILNTEFAVNEASMDGVGLSTDERQRATAAAMSILSRIVMATVSAVGIYAVVSGRAALLMPLYAMLLCDFFFSLPAFYSRDIELADGNGFSPDMKHGQHPQYTRYSIILFSTIAMIVKMYFLCVVWKCYRYMRLIELVTPIRLSEIYPHLPPAGAHGYPVVRVLGSIDSTDLSSGHNVTPPPYDTVASSMKPPNYEEAIKSSGTVFTIDNAQQQQLQQQQPQQTMVLNMPNLERGYPTTQVIVAPNVGRSGDASNSCVSADRSQANSTSVSNPPNSSSSSDSTNIAIQETPVPDGEVSSSDRPAR